MNPLDQARRYLAAIPPAVSGQAGHNQTFSVACALVHGFALPEADALALLREYNAACAPAWSEKELAHKIKTAVNANHQKPRGHLLNSRSLSSPSRAIKTAHRPPEQPAEPVTKPTAYMLDPEADLPKPIESGTVALLESCFRTGEGVRIVAATVNEEDSRELPDGSGVCLSREEWLRKLNAKGGNPNKLWTQKDGGGIYISLNPMKVGGSKDADVTDYRHALIEFDAGLSPAQQFQLYHEAKLPCSAIIYSGGKSVHAWVKVEAQDRAEYDARVKILYDHFAASGFTLDEKNKNPSRLSRLPGCHRFQSRQELLALNTGLESFTTWLAHVNGDGLGDVMRFDDLMKLDAKADPNCVIGFRNSKSLRYLCKGKSAFIIAPSGQGKSSLAAEFAIAWGQGKDFCGIGPNRKLKSLIIQAENDQFDLAEMAQGIANGHGLQFDDAAMADVNENVIFKTETTSIGLEFCNRLHRLIDKIRPDVVWLDPMLSFVGVDVSKQVEVSQFLRQQLQPILEATGVVLIGIHHTGKVKSSKETANWTAIDYAYAGIGSSEFVNWARAIMYLHRIEQGKYELKLAKRGSRAGAHHPNEQPAYESVFIKHADTGIKWEQMDAPIESDDSTNEPRKNGRPNKVEEIIALGLGSIVDTITEPTGFNEVAKMIQLKHGKSTGASLTTFKNVVKKLIENGALNRSEEGLIKA